MLNKAFSIKAWCKRSGAKGGAHRAWRTGGGAKGGAHRAWHKRCGAISDHVTGALCLFSLALLKLVLYVRSIAYTYTPAKSKHDAHKESDAHKGKGGACLWHLNTSISCASFVFLRNASNRLGGAKFRTWSGPEGSSHKGPLTSA